MGAIPAPESPLRAKTTWPSLCHVLHACISDDQLQIYSLPQLEADHTFVYSPSAFRLIPANVQCTHLTHTPL